MTDNKKTVECSACHKHIPLSAALTAEGAEYVRYFCSEACYQSMLNQSDD